MCDAHKNTGSELGEEIDYSNNIQVLEEKKVMVQIPKGSTDQQITTFVDKVAEVFKKIF